MKFAEVEKVAQQKDCRLERGSANRIQGMQTGFILWHRGLWKQYQSLKAVMAKLDTLPNKEPTPVQRGER